MIHDEVRAIRREISLKREELDAVAREILPHAQGNLRRLGISGHTLAQLKHELRDFDGRTQRWKS